MDIAIRDENGEKREYEHSRCLCKRLVVNAMSFVNADHQSTSPRLHSPAYSGTIPNKQDTSEHSKGPSTP
eukprot:1139288-Pyramimonas_sp.AAC.1